MGRASANLAWSEVAKQRWSSDPAGLPGISDRGNASGREVDHEPWGSRGTASLRKGLEPGVSEQGRRGFRTRGSLGPGDPKRSGRCPWLVNTGGLRVLNDVVPWLQNREAHLKRTRFRGRKGAPIAMWKTSTALSSPRTAISKADLACSTN